MRVSFFQKMLKKLKLGIDKANGMCYYNQAVAFGGRAEKKFEKSFKKVLTRVRWYVIMKFRS